LRSMRSALQADRDVAYDAARQSRPADYGRNRVREHVKLVEFVDGLLGAARGGRSVVLLVSKLVIVRLGNIPNGPPPEVMAWLPAW